MHTKIVDCLRIRRAPHDPGAVNARSRQRPIRPNQKSTTILLAHELLRRVCAQILPPKWVLYCGSHEATHPRVSLTVLPHRVLCLCIKSYVAIFFFGSNFHSTCHTCVFACTLITLRPIEFAVFVCLYICTLHNTHGWNCYDYTLSGYFYLLSTE